ncbi:MAG: ferredoxin [Candidatus Pacebacteria bacterium]|nr:ferredoxin [Candidatus Paceibacterota bacterium]
MVKITQKHNDCIGCGVCVAACSDFWEMGDNNKAKLKNGILNSQTGNYELETSEPSCNKDAADMCPVKIIEIS